MKRFHVLHDLNTLRNTKYSLKIAEKEKNRNNKKQISLKLWHSEIPWQTKLLAAAAVRYLSVTFHEVN